MRPKLFVRLLHLPGSCSLGEPELRGAAGGSPSARPRRETPLATSLENIGVFPAQGHPVRLLPLLDTRSRPIKKREERSNNAPTSSQP